MSNDLDKQMLTREIRGLDVELGIKRRVHYVLTHEIEDLERQRRDLADRLMKREAGMADK